jgi:hypothetical protein
MDSLIKKILLETKLIKEETEHVGKTYSYTSATPNDYDGINYVWFNGLKEVGESKHYDFGNDNFEPEVIPLTVFEGPQGTYTVKSFDLIWNRNKTGLRILATKLIASNNDTSKIFNSIDANKLAIKIKSEPKRKFQTAIRESLKEIYSKLKGNNGEPFYGVSESSPECETNEGVINFKGIRYGLENKLVSNWSILNYFDTNSKIIEFLLNEYSKTTGNNLNDITDLNFNEFLDNFVSWIKENKIKLLSPTSEILDELEKINLETVTRGIENEQRAIPVLIRLHNIDSKGMTEYCPGSKEDTLKGRDIKINKENIYYQIKPLSGKISSNNGNYTVRTSNFKKYGNTVNRIMFISNNYYYIFENKNYVVNKFKDSVIFNDPPISYGSI